MTDVTFTYRAFISYSHADHDWGVWLHRALERYRVPKRLAGAEGQKRLGKCFRDEEELGAAAELGPRIEKALQSSDALIVVCSPRSARSKWVNQEIEAFKRLGRERRVFALIVDGTPHGTGDECFPEALKRTVAGGAAEPLAVDVRKFGREDAAVRLIAGMLEVGYDDLRQREVRRRRAEMLRARAILVTGMLLTIGALGGAYLAAANYVDASEMRAEIFAREANSLSAEGDYAKAMLMALQSDPAAQAGLIERLFRPDGYTVAKRALVSAITHNRLLSVVSTEASIAELSPDGRTVLLVSSYAPAQLVDVGSGAILREFKPDRLGIRPRPRVDGETTVDEEAADGNESEVDDDRFRDDEPDDDISISAVAFSKDGSKVLTETSSGRIDIWSANSGERLAHLKGLLNERTHLLALSHNGDEVVVIANADWAWRLDAAGKREPVDIIMPGSSSIERNLSTYPNYPYGEPVALSPDGQYFLQGYQDGHVDLFRIEDSSLVRAFNAAEPVTSVALSHDGSSILVGLYSGTVQMLDRNSGAMVWSRQSSKQPVSALTFSSDDQLVVQGFFNGLVAVSSRNNDRSDLIFLAHLSEVKKVRMSPDGATLMTTADDFEKRDRSVRLWRVGDVAATDGDLRTEPNTRMSPSRRATAMTVSPDGARMLAGFSDGQVRVIDLNNGHLLIDLIAHSGEVSALAFSPDGKWIATGGARGDAAVKLWTTNGESTAQVFAGHDDSFGVSSLSFSPDSKSLLSASGDGTALVWPVAGGPSSKVVGHDGPLNTAVFSPDGRQVFVGISDLIGDGFSSGIWPVGEGKPKVFVADARFGSSIEAGLFSKDGERLLQGGDSHAASLLSVRDGQVMRVFRGHEDVVDGVWFADDERLVVTTSRDGTAKLWDVEGGPSLATINVGIDQAKLISPSPDGRELIGLSPSNELRRWTVPESVFIQSERQVALACQTLKHAGFVKFEDSDYQRFPILDRNAPHPCTKVWGGDPRVSRDADGEVAK